MSADFSKRQGLQFTRSAVLALHKMMEGRGLTFEQVAREMGCSAEELEAWLKSTEDVGIEDFMTFWAIVLDEGDNDEVLEAITDRRIRRREVAAGPEPGGEGAAEGEFDGLLESLGRSAQILVREGALDGSLLEYIVLRSRERRKP